MMAPTISDELIACLQTMGSLGPAWFTGVFILATLLFPASLLAMLAGYLYGPMIGSVATSFAGLMSAVLAFLISRYLAGERMAAWSLVSEVSQLSERGETVSHITGVLAVTGGVVVIMTLTIIARSARRILIQKVIR